MIADFYIYQEKYEQAEAELMKLIEAQQSYEVKRVGYERLSSFYPYKGKYEKALWACDKKIELFWQAKDTAWAATTHNYKGFLMQWGWADFDNAWKEAEKAFPYNHRISLGPYWTSLFELCILQRKYAMAESLATQKLHVHPDMPFSALYSSKHECAKAQALIETELKSKPKFNTTGAVIILKLHQLAQCQFEEAELDDATKSLFRLQTIYINDYGLRAVCYPKSFYLLGQIYEKKGDKKRAIESYTKLLHLWKDADQDLPELIDTKTRLAKLRRA
jgi:tetratricopeptide (TPR) repeat protein